MSHFSVLVIGDNVEEKLAPYQENNMGDCPRQFTQFTDVEEKSRLEYETEKIEMAEYKDGSRRFTWDPIVKAEVKKKVKTYKLVSVPLSDRYTSFEIFMKEWHGYSKDELLGRYGYWENPNKKWDWYSIGGRWAGLFKVREGALSAKGEKSLFRKDDPYKDGRADQAMFCDIDWEGMVTAKDVDHYRSEWNVAIGDVKLTDVEIFRKFGMMYKKEWYVTKYQTVENFIRLRSQFTTYAVITEDGKWCQKGEMGWWGIDDATPNRERDWEEYYHMNFIEPLKLKPNTVLTIVDCHI